MEPTPPPAAEPRGDVPETSSREPFELAGARYTSVGGWLALFCFGILVIQPVIAFASVIQVITVGEMVDVIPRLRSYLWADALVTCATTSLGIVAGVKLMRIRADAVRVARLALVMFPIGALASLPLPSLFGLPDELASVAYAQAGAQLLRASIYATIWLLYFAKSDRVARTYGDAGMST